MFPNKIIFLRVAICPIVKFDDFFPYAIASNCFLFNRV